MRWTRSPKAGPSSGRRNAPVVGLAVDRGLVEPAAAREAEDRHPERVVHQRVEPVAGQPLRRLAPDLADEVGVGADGPDAPPELRPERRVVDVGRGRRGASRRSRTGASARRRRTGTRAAGGCSTRSFGSDGTFHHDAVAGRRRRRRRRAAGRRRSSASAVEHVRIEVEPVAIRRLQPGLEDVLEREEAATGVVEHAVEDDPDPARVGRVEQLPERGVAAEQRIDRQVVRRVVAVVRGGREDRVQVEPADPEVGEIVEAVRRRRTGRRP